jgi:hypothetical protein
MNVPLFLAGLLAFVAAGVHGVGGDVLVLRQLWQEPLPRTRFGGAAMTRSMVHVTWHITTFAFLAVGVGMIVSASVLDGDAAEALAWFTAAAFTGFAAVAVGLGAAGQPLRAATRHPGPIVLAGTAGLSLWGAFLA